MELLFRYNHRGVGVVRWTMETRFCCCWLLLFMFIATSVDATVYTHNETGRVAAYPSLPALFGEQFLEGRLYEGVLQYLVENPFLCDAIDYNTTSFVNSTSTTTSNGEYSTQEDRPIVMLATRGDCPFHFKAMAAESLGPRVQFLIIYNHNLDGEDVLVPMYSEYGTSRLKLLSVTHRTGTALKRYIADYQNVQKQTPQQGPAKVMPLPPGAVFEGPLVSMDSLPPEGVMTAQDLQDVLVSTLGLFFMLVSFSGCFLMCAAAAQHGRRHTHENGRRASPLWMLLMGDPDNIDPDPTAMAGRNAFGRTLLTTEEVQEFLINRRTSSNNSETRTRASSAGSSIATTRPPRANENSTQQQEQPDSSSPSSSSSSNNNTNNSNSNEPPPPQASTTTTVPPVSGDSPNYTHCAICIDDFDENSTEPILKLPCNHAFHTDCIVPWLTERQSKCPLCKYDVLGYVQELAAEQPPPQRRWRTSSSRHNNHADGPQFPSSWFSFYTPVHVVVDTAAATTQTTELEMTTTTTAAATTTTTAPRTESPPSTTTAAATTSGLG